MEFGDQFINVHHSEESHRELRGGDTKLEHDPPNQEVQWNQTPPSTIATIGTKILSRRSVSVVGLTASILDGAIQG